MQDAPRLAFVYGSREVLWGGITSSLFAQEGAMRDVLLRCEQLVQERLGWSLRGVFATQLFDNEQLRDPALTALQIALTQGWRERGVEPDVIAARSGGEFAAEFARGAITLEGAIAQATVNRGAAGVAKRAELLARPLP
jgi:acyl transferase domain-containing protein